MREPPKQKKRIVSKREYAAQIGKKAALTLGSFGLAVITAVFLLIAFGTFFIGLWSGSIWVILLCIGMAVSTGWIGITIKNAAEQALAQATSLDTGVPLTRANMADLPAPESLVRASAEPVQEQQTVLLRAAAAGEQTDAEQLVRPVEDLEDY